MPLRCMAYTSGARPCGIADYHARLAPYVAADVHTVPLPTVPVLRDRPFALLRQRARYRALAAAADGHDVVLLQMLQSWNAFRLGEYLLPTFLARLRPPLVVVMHEWPDGVEDEAGGGVRGLARRAGLAALRQYELGGDDFEAWLRRVFFPRIAHFFVHAEALRARLLAARVPADKITCSFMPVYAAAAPSAGAPTQVPDDRQVVLLFGFPHPRKRYDIAVRALAQLPADTVLLLVGSVEGDFRRRYVEELRQLAETHGVGDRLVVTGEVEAEALPAIFARAHAALAPVGYATGSASLGYLIAAGVPIVASDVPSIAALRDAGAGIATFAAGDSDACAVVLRRVLGDEAHRSDLRLRSQRFAAVHTFARLGAAVGEQLRRVVADRSAADAGGFAPAGALR